MGDDLRQAWSGRQVRLDTSRPRAESPNPNIVPRDRCDKKDLDARFGLREYWLGDPAHQALEILTLKSGHYELLCEAARRGNVHSLALPGLKFDLAEIL